MKIKDMELALEGTKAKKLFAEMYGEAGIAYNVKRYKNVMDGFLKRYGEQDIELFRAAGRTEIGGNHTDHNNGQVLAGSIQLDCIGAAAKTSGHMVHIVSENYNQDFSIDLTDLSSDHEVSSKNLVTGLLAGFQSMGYQIGGFDAYVSSNVIAAAGISSSASFEMMICAIINSFYNEDKLNKVQYAQIGQYSENNYWGKQSGLLDQMACAVGGLIHIDFKSNEKPVVEQINYDFDKEDYNIVIVNTGKSHADLSDEYSSIPREMKEVAHFFGKEVCAEITKSDVLSHIQELRSAVGDRAILRSLHFFDENERVVKQVEALRHNEFQQFLGLITESGNSSYKVLQNCYAIDNYKEQGIPLALVLTEMFLKEHGAGACRVHGGGFAGVIMALLPNSIVEKYMEYMEQLLGEGCAYRMRISPWGAINVTELISE